MVLAKTFTWEVRISKGFDYDRETSRAMSFLREQAKAWREDNFSDERILGLASSSDTIHFWDDGEKLLFVYTHLIVHKV
jgi:hypothetical protein